MACTKRLTGIFAIAVVAFMVATAFVPAVNAFASSSDGEAASITSVKGADPDGYNVAAEGGEADILSMLSSLLGGADLSQLKDVIGDLDLKSLLQEVKDLDSGTIVEKLGKVLGERFSALGGTQDGLIKSIAAFLGADDEDFDINAIIEFIINFIGSNLDGAYSYYFPHLALGALELESVSISVIFDKGTPVSATVYVDEIYADPEYELPVPIILQDVRFDLAADSVDFYLGTLVYDGVGIPLQLYVTVYETENGAVASMQFAGTLTVSMVTTDSSFGTRNVFSVEFSSLSLRWDDEDITLNDFKFEFEDGYHTGFSASVESAYTKEGKDITAEVNAALEDFCEHPYALDKVLLGNVSIGPLDLYQARLTTGVSGEGVLQITVDALSYGLGQYTETDHVIQGLLWITELELGHEHFSYSDHKGSIIFYDKDDTQFSISATSLDFVFAYDGVENDSVSHIFQVDRISATDQDGNIRITWGDDAISAISEKYMENFDTDEAGYILYVDSAKVTTQTEYGEEIDYLYGLYLDGEYDGTPSTQDATAEVTAKIWSYEGSDAPERITDAYVHMDYRKVGEYKVLTSEAEVFSTPLTYLEKVSVTWGDLIDVSWKTGVGIGRSPHLSGDDFLCVFATANSLRGVPDYTVEYHLAGDSDAIWSFELRIRDDGATVEITGTDLEYHTYNTIGKAQMTVVMTDGIVSTVLQLNDVSLGNTDGGLHIGYLSVIHNRNGFTGAKTFTVVAEDVTFCDEKVSDMFVYKISLSKDGEFLEAPAVSGDLDLNIAAPYALVDAQLYIEGTAKIADNKLTSNILFKKTVGATDAIGSIVIDDTSVAIKFTSPDPSNYFVGPFETPWVDIVFGKGTENKYEYSASNIWFRKDVDTGETKSYMSGVGYTGTGPEQFSITKIRFGELNDTTVQVSFSNVIIVFDSGYTVKVGEQTTSISYVDISALTLATLHTSFGVGTADDAVVIRCYKENDVMYTENTVRIESVLAAVRLPGDDDTDSKFLCGYIGKNLSSATDLATVYTKEDAGHYAILRTVTGLSTSMYISQGGAEGEQYYSVSATDFNIDIDESLTDDPLKSVSVGQVCFVSTESAFEFNNFHKTQKDMYAVDSFSVSGFGQSGDGKIVSEGTVTIDATAENKAVITIPKITLDSQAAASGSELVITDIVITAVEDDRDADVTVGAVHAKFQDFYYKPTSSTINGTLEYDSKNPQNTTADISIDKISMEQWFIEGIVYKYSLGASGAPAVDLLTVASVDLYSSSTDHNIVMTELSGDRVKREYSVKEIVFTSYEYGEYWINGKIAGISYSASAGTSMVPEFGLTVGKTEIEMSNAYTKVGFMTNGISVSLTASAGESGSHRIVLAATGDIGWSIETSGYMSAFSASLKDFNATVVSTSDRSTWDVTASQKEAVVYYASSDVGEGIIMSFDGSGDKFSGSMKISQGKAVITGLYNHDDVLSVQDPNHLASYAATGTGELYAEFPLDTNGQNPVDFRYEYTLDKLVVTDGDQTVNAKIDEVGFTLSACSEDEYAAELDVYADFEYAVGSQSFKVENFMLYAALDYDEDGDIGDMVSVEMSAHRLAIGLDCNFIDINNISLSDGWIDIEQVAIACTDPECPVSVTFYEVSPVGTVLIADHMTGYVDDTDVQHLTYDKKQEPGKQLSGYRGVFYFSVYHGIAAFTNTEPVVEPEGSHIVLYVPTYEMTFYEPGDIYGSSYDVPRGTMVDLGGYYDVTPWPSVDAGVPVTTDYYTVRSYSVDITPAKTLDDLIRPSGTVRLSAGSGFVYDAAMVDRLTVQSVTVITAQDVYMTISKDALKILTTGCGTTMLGVTVEDADDSLVNVEALTEGLSPENAEKVLSGVVVSVDTGRSTRTAGLGDVTISIPLHLLPEKDLKMSCYFIDGMDLVFHGMCNFTTIDGQLYLSFTTSHFSSFVICEELVYETKDVSVYWLIVMVAAIAVACLVVMFARRNTF